MLPLNILSSALVANGDGRYGGGTGVVIHTSDELKYESISSTTTDSIGGAVMHGVFDRQSDVAVGACGVVCAGLPFVLPSDHI